MLTQSLIDNSRKPYVVHAFIHGVTLTNGFDTEAEALARFEALKAKAVFLEVVNPNDDVIAEKVS